MVDKWFSAAAGLDYETLGTLFDSHSAQRDFGGNTALIIVCQQTPRSTGTSLSASDFWQRQLECLRILVKEQLITNNINCTALMYLICTGWATPESISLLSDECHVKCPLYPIQIAVDCNVSGDCISAILDADHNGPNSLLPYKYTHRVIASLSIKYSTTLQAKLQMYHTSFATVEGWFDDIESLNYEGLCRKVAKYSSAIAKDGRSFAQLLLEARSRFYLKEFERCAQLCDELSHPDCSRATTRLLDAMLAGTLTTNDIKAMREDIYVTCYMPSLNLVVHPLSLAFILAQRDSRSAGNTSRSANFLGGSRLAYEPLQGKKVSAHIMEYLIVAYLRGIHKSKPYAKTLFGSTPQTDMHMLRILLAATYPTIASKVTHESLPGLVGTSCSSLLSQLAGRRIVFNLDEARARVSRIGRAMFSYVSSSFRRLKRQQDPFLVSWFAAARSCDADTLRKLKEQCLFSIDENGDTALLILSRASLDPTLLGLAIAEASYTKPAPSADDTRKVVEFALLNILRMRRTMSDTMGLLKLFSRELHIVSDGKYPLELAVEYHQNAEVVDCLIQLEGRDVHFGQIVLKRAARHIYEEYFPLFLRYAASFAEATGWFAAAKQGDVQTLKRLASTFSDRTTGEPLFMRCLNQAGYSALMCLCATKESIPCCGFLQPEIGTTNSNGYTALSLAIHNGVVTRSLVQLLKNEAVLPSCPAIRLLSDSPSMPVTSPDSRLAALEEILSLDLSSCEEIFNISEHSKYTVEFLVALRAADGELFRKYAPVFAQQSRWFETVNNYELQRIALFAPAFSGVLNETGNTLLDIICQAETSDYLVSLDTDQNLSVVTEADDPCNACKELELTSSVPLSENLPADPGSLQPAGAAKPNDLLSKKYVLLSRIIEELSEEVAHPDAEGKYPLALALATHHDNAIIAGLLQVHLKTDGLLVRALGGEAQKATVLELLTLLSSEYSSVFNMLRADIAHAFGWFSFATQATTDDLKDASSLFSGCSYQGRMAVQFFLDAFLSSGFTLPAQHSGDSLIEAVLGILFNEYELLPCAVRRDYLDKIISCERCSSVPSTFLKDLEGKESLQLSPGSLAILLDKIKAKDIEKLLEVLLASDTATAEKHETTLANPLANANVIGILFNRFSSVFSSHRIRLAAACHWFKAASSATPDILESFVQFFECTQDSDGKTALMHLVSTSADQALMGQCIGILHNEVGKCDTSGLTALMHSIKSGHVTTDILTHLAREVTTSTKDGALPLSIAVVDCSPDIIASLITIMRNDSTARLPEILQSSVIYTLHQRHQSLFEEYALFFAEQLSWFKGARSGDYPFIRDHAYLFAGLREPQSGSALGPTASLLLCKADNYTEEQFIDLLFTDLGCELEMAASNGETPLHFIIREKRLTASIFKRFSGLLDNDKPQYPVVTAVEERVPEEVLTLFLASDLSSSSLTEQGMQTAATKYSPLCCDIYHGYKPLFGQYKSRLARVLGWFDPSRLSVSLVRNFASFFRECADEKGVTASMRVCESFTDYDDAKQALVMLRSELALRDAGGSDPLEYARRNKSIGDRLTKFISGLQK